ncbi:Acetyltransferase (GNAT) family protein [Streptomyces sp. YIM 130001]|uniref:GNAT family N-acetyltransferase n=1 Tax=Streptomyces sp. YIM 130001 TaxID=2259644 RepID=UPI000E658809|nr:GNAT family N-acetyltransferase [Streptomyces sp. YIM 130001]RII19794.1 Acetyltransferase (GNAT) family protein [Streptomyces sp. YIM 130001]
MPDPRHAPTRVPACRTERLVLVPLRVEHAAEMAEVLSDPALHAFTGGAPLDTDALRSRYERLTAGSPDPAVVWCNWVLEWCATGRLAGTVQATVTPDTRTAEIAWVVGTGWQGRGIAKEAARALVELLREQYGVTVVVAHVHPDHHASAAVAAAAGLAPTGHLHDGERRWQLSPPS